MVFFNDTKDVRLQTTREERVIWMASTRPESSPAKRLHNFILPSDLRWGNQQHLRCMKGNSNDEEIPPAVDHRFSFGAHFSSEASNSLRKRKDRERFVDDSAHVSSDLRRRSEFKKMGSNFEAVTPPPRKFRSSGIDDSGDGGNGIAEVREKLMCDIRTAADKMKGAILNEDMATAQKNCNNSSSQEQAAAQASVSAAYDDIVRPRTLRTRKAACKSPADNGHAPDCAGVVKGAAISTGKALEYDATKNTNIKNPRLRNGVSTVEVVASSENKERAKFSARLIKSEIEEDFLVLTGRKPHRRPHKRPRSVQKQIDTLYPGLWLTEITADRYKTSEPQ